MVGEHGPRTPWRSAENNNLAGSMLGFRGRPLPLLCVAFMLIDTTSESFQGAEMERTGDSLAGWMRTPMSKTREL